MKLLNYRGQTANDKMRDIKHNARAKTPYVTAQARKEGQQWYERAQTTLRRAMLLTAAGGALLQHFKSGNEKKRRKQRKHLAHKATRWQEQAQNTLQPALTKTRHILQDSTDATQKTLKAGLETIQESTYQTQKNLQHMQKVARKNLEKGWSSAQDGLEAGWSGVQGRVEEGSQQVRSNLAQVATSTQNAKKTLHKRIERHHIKRMRSRRLFRWGLASGFLLSLLFAPLRGAEIRKQIGLFWNRYKQYLTSGQSNEQVL